MLFYFGVSESEKELIKNLLQNAIDINMMTVREFEALNSLRKKFNLPIIGEIDDVDLPKGRGYENEPN